MEYTLKQALTVFQTIKQFIDDSPKMLQEDGVFRLSGSILTIKQLIDNILTNTTDDDLNPDIHAYVGALKMVFKGSVNTENQAYQQAIQAIIDSDGTTLAPLVDRLLNSGSIEDLYLAKMLYIIMNLAVSVHNNQDVTRMTATNIGIVFGAMFCVDGSIDATRKLSSVVESVIKSNECFFENTFEDYIIANHSGSVGIIGSTYDASIAQLKADIVRVKTFITASQSSIDSQSMEVYRKNAEIDLVEESLQDMQEQLTSKIISKAHKTQLREGIAGMERFIAVEKENIVILKQRINQMQRGIKSARVEKRVCITERNHLKSQRDGLNAKYEEQELARLKGLIEKAQGKNAMINITLDGHRTKMTVRQFKQEYDDAKSDYSRDFDLTSGDEAFFSQLSSKPGMTFFVKPRAASEAHQAQASATATATANPQ
jgi:RhoGAP domain